jgi:tRNA(Ile)-lysidine synthase
MDLDAHIAARLEAHVPRGAALCAGLSGGLDSVVLLDLLVRASGDRALSAVHVHHGLSPNADHWAGFCGELCSARGVPLSVERVRVDPGAPEGLEAAARAARYAVYAERPEDFVVLAHHRDDQAETLLLNLLRGTGLRGMAAMPEVRELPGSRVRLLRPLLEVPRAALRTHASERGLRWIEDESNASTRHDRNYLRRDIAPLLDVRLPRWREAALRFARHSASAQTLLEALARIDGLPQRAGEPLPADPGLPEERRANLLRAFLALNGAAMPSEARLGEMARQLFGARGDARIRLEHDGLEVVRYRGRVHLERGAPDPSPWRRPWHGELEVDLGEDRGTVRFERATGDGLAASRTRGEGWHFAGRSGGERLRPDAHRPNRTLKNLLQEHAVPEWQRNRMPLLFHGEHLVWVPGIGIDTRYACAPGEPGLRPEWLPRGGEPSQPTHDVLN